METLHVSQGAWRVDVGKSRPQAMAWKERPELCRQSPVAWKMERRCGKCGGVASYVGKGSVMSGRRKDRVGAQERPGLSRQSPVAWQLIK